MSNWVKRATKKSFQKRLAVAITAGLLAGVYAPMGMESMAEAATAAHEQPIKVEAAQNLNYDNVKISTEGAGNYAVLNDGTVYIGAGKIHAKDEYAIKNNGTLNINASTTPEGAIIGTKHRINIDGNIYQGATGTANIVMDTYGSKLHGVVSKADGGTVNMVLSDSSEWINEGSWKTSKKVSHVKPDGSGYEIKTIVTEVKLNDTGFKGSHITNLTAGKPGSTHAYDRGSIIQKDNNPLRIDNLSGNLIVHYDRKTGIGTESSHYIGGDTIIGHAEAGTTITISTPKLPGDKNVSNFIDFGPNADIYVDDFTLNKILDTLAGKLVYEGALKGETSLNAKVQIGSGMTASSASVKVENITFDETGRGQYIYDVPYDFNSIITGSKDMDTQYFAAGVIKSEGQYVFDGKRDVNIDNNKGIVPLKNITIDTQGKNLNLNTYVAGIFDDSLNDSMVQGATDSTTIINANAVNINVDGSGFVGGIDINNVKYRDEIILNVQNGGLNMNVHSAGEAGNIACDVFGIRSGGKASSVTVNGDMNLKGKGNTWGLSLGLTPSRAYHHIAGLYAEKGGKININGNVDMAVQGSGIVTRGDGSVVNVKGGTILIDRDLVSDIETVRPGQQKTNYANMYSLVTRGGNINMNMNQALDGADNNTVEISGNIGVLQGEAGFKGTINLGLSNAESSLTGVVYNTGNINNDTGEFSKNSAFNLYLSNGATWNNEDFGHVKTTDTDHWKHGKIPGFKGSIVDKLVGGATSDKAGFIKQKDGQTLTLDNYSGFTNIYYDHINKGNQASDYAAGDTYINKAAVGSGITVMTDNNGINMNDIQEVNSVLNTLAGKLFYKGYIAGATQEKNLSGKVQIVSGMTASAAVKDFADIIFSEVTGQGSIDMNDVPPTPTPGVTEFKNQITGQSTDKEYVDAGILYKDKYTFVDNANITVTDGTGAPAYGQAVIDAKKSFVIDATGKTITLNANGQGKKEAVGIKNVGKGLTADITAGNLVINASNVSGNPENDGKATGIYVEHIGKDAKNIVNITSNVAINATGGDKVYGIHTKGNAEVNINGNVTMTDSKDGWGIEHTSGNRDFYEVNGILAYSDLAPGAAASGSKVNINGNVDLAVKGTAIRANGAGSEVNINGGGNIVIDDTNPRENYAIFASSGFVNMNMNANKDGSANNKVNIKGNIGVEASSKGMAHSNEPEKRSIINIGLATQDSTFEGVVHNYVDPKFASQGYTNEVNLYVSNGATWTNEIHGAVDKAKFKGSVVNKFVGGKDEGSAGNIVQKHKSKITINDYSGHTEVFYEHKGDATTAEAFAHLGDTVIKNAAANSSITMLTQKGNTNMQDADAVNKVLNNLANKLVYMNSATDKNLTGKVGISSGCTSSSASLQLGDIAFGSDNKGSLVAGSVKPGVTNPDPGTKPDPNPPVTPGDYETYMMAGARAVMTDSILAWRDIAADNFNRSGEMRNGVEAGAWARIYGGENKYDGGALNIQNSYKALQAGFDKEVGDWTVGAVFDYRDGESDYMLGGEGEQTNYSVGVYGVKAMSDGSYLDLAAKLGKVENEYKVYNEMGELLDGKYSAPGYSLSAQYGKRIEKGEGYFEPQLQLTWSHVDGDDYTAMSGGETMDVKQDAFDSLVGRIGIEAGAAGEKGSVYTRLSLNHEFMGDTGIDCNYFAKDGGGKKTNFALNDTVSSTWSELTIGGRYNLTKCANFYADVTKALTGDYKQEWKVNAGFSFSF